MTRRYNGQLGAEAVEARLAKKFAAPEYAFMTQVGNATGFGTNRHADAIAMSLWPSRGIELHGFEIKVSRNDWQRELKDPAKAEAIQKFCHYWWIVTPPDVITPGDLMPSTWGHMETSGTGLTVKVKAPRREAEPLSTLMIASLFRSFAETVPFLSKSYVHQDDVKKLVDEGVESQIARRTGENRLLADLQELQSRVTAFEKASGIKITDGWNKADDVGAAVRIVQDLMYRGGARAELARLSGDLRRLVDQIGKVANATFPKEEREELERTA